MVRAVNEAREDHGRRALRPSRRLTRSAGRVAAKLAKLDVLGHLESAPAGSGARGEALARHRGWRARARSTVRRWLRSPSHRAVILGRFRTVGAGIKRGRVGGRLTTVWVLHLRAPPVHLAQLRPSCRWITLPSSFVTAASPVTLTWPRS